MITVAWCGMGGGSYSAKELRPTIEKLGMKLTIISEWSDADVQWNLNTWKDELRKHDILICPIDYMKFPFKGNNKLTQCMALGKPVIASPLQSYREIIRQGENGFIADTLPDWERHLTTLRDDAELREKMGMAALETVQGRYSSDTAADKILECFDSVQETIDIIIPNYNNPHYLLETVRSLLAHSSKDQIVIHLVDSSTDGFGIGQTLSLIEESGFKYTFKQMPPRTSFSEQVNWGLEHSQNDLVLIGNNDLLFTEGWDLPLREFVKSNPEAMVQPLSNCDKGWLHNYSLITKKGVSLEPGLHNLDTLDKEDVQESVEVLTRSEVVGRDKLAFYCVLFRRKLIDRIGVLDATYQNGGEDFDYCYRAAKAGWKFYSIHSSFVFHFGGKTRKVSETENFDRHHKEDHFNNLFLSRKLGKSMVAFYLGPGWEKWDESNLINGGIGGSETAAIWVARELSKLGYQVKMFADPHKEHMDSSGDDVEYLHHSRWNKFSKSTFIDFLICSRTVAPLHEFYHAYKKFVWIHDVFISHDRSLDVCVPDVNNYLALSDWHKDFVSDYHGIPKDKILITSNGVDPTRYLNKTFEKNPHQIFYSSSPDRGLDTLLYCSDFIKQYVPDLKIIVAYGFTNWERAVRFRNDANEIAWMESIKSSLGKSQVEYVGRVDQNKLADIQLQSSAWTYPTRFHETNCITAIEAGFAGNAILCSNLAGLITTVKDSGILLDGDAYTKEYREKFVEEAVKLLLDKNYRETWSERSQTRMKKFTWKNVAAQWHKLFQDGVFEQLQ